MSQTVPTTQALADDIVADVDAELDHSTPFLAKTFTRVLGKTLAGANVLLWKYGSWMLLQMFVQTASMKETTVLGVTVRPLVFWGRLFGAGDPLAASRAELVVLVTVLVQSGSIEAGRQFVYAPTGIVYTATAAVALNAALVLVTVRAASDQQGGAGEGILGNLVPGTALQMANPLPNVARAVTVWSQSVTGADAETEDDYRARVIRRVQQKPQGGAYADYQLWGEEGPGIIHVYPYTGAPGQMDVYIEATPDSSGSPDGIPTSAQLAEVLALINLDQDGKATRRPGNAFINVLPISRVVFDVVVTGLFVDDEPTAESSTEEAVTELLHAAEPFIVGLSVLPRKDRITLAAISGVIDDVASSLGGSVAAVTLKLAGDAITAYTLGKGEKAKLGTVTYI